jgi:hypothetical protein
MPLFTRARTAKQQAHTASRSASHKKDKREGEARRQTRFIAVKAAEHPRKKRNFAGIEGHEYKFDGAIWTNCEDPEEYEKYSVEQARFRSTYIDSTTRHGRPIQMVRRVATPTEIITTNCSPWFCDWVEAQIAAGRDPRLQIDTLEKYFIYEALPIFQGQRFVLGRSLHADTDNLHFDLLVSRQDGFGGRIGKSGLMLGGAWLVATERQLRSGAKIAAYKMERVEKDMANFKFRYPEPFQEQLDIRLSRILDEGADGMLGRELLPFKKAYAASVPEIERQHALAELAVLKAAEANVHARIEAKAPDETFDPYLGGAVSFGTSQISPPQQTQMPPKESATKPFDPEFA